MAVLTTERPRSLDLDAGTHADDERLDEDGLIRRHMSVARDVARRYRGRGVAEEDLEQVAYLGLVKAARRFESGRGSDFLSYAVPTIRGEVRRYFRDHGWSVRPPRPIQQAQAQIREAEGDLVQTLGRSPRPSEIAEHLGLDVEVVIEALAANGCFAPVSLDVAAGGSSGDEEGRALREVLGDEDPRLATADELASLGPALSRLTEREKTMLRMRFYEGATQAEIGAVLGVTQMTVSRLLSTLIARLRDDLAGDA